jgi:hypothetical protein
LVQLSVDQVEVDSVEEVPLVVVHHRLAVEEEEEGG